MNTFTGPAAVFYEVRVHDTAAAAYTLLDTDPSGNPWRAGKELTQR